MEELVIKNLMEQLDLSRDEITPESRLWRISRWIRWTWWRC